MARKLILALCCVLGCASTAQAHHSATMYDRKKTMIVHGTIKSFNWTNPHVFLELQADPDGPGRGELWTLETTSPGTLTRSGWTKRSLNPGDRVTVQFNPLTAGGLGGNFSKVTLADGKVLGWSFTPKDFEHP